MSQHFKSTPIVIKHNCGKVELASPFEFCSWKLWLNFAFNLLVLWAPVLSIEGVVAVGATIGELAFKMCINFQATTRSSPQIHNCTESFVSISLYRAKYPVTLHLSIRPTLPNIIIKFSPSSGTKLRKNKYSLDTRSCIFKPSLIKKKSENLYFSVGEIKTKFHKVFRF